MIKTLQTLLFICFWSIFIACQTDNKERILNMAEGLMETQPDSVVRVLKEIDYSTFDFDYQRAMFALLWTQARHKCHLPLVNDSLIDVAVAYFTENGERQYAAKALLYKGLVHKQRKEVEKAAEAFAMSEQWFEGVEDDQYKALLYSHYASLMMKEENHEDALYYMKKAYNLELKGDSIHYAVSSCVSIANIFELLGKMDSAKIYFEEGLRYKEYISLQRHLSLLQNYANFLRKNKEYDRAEKILVECEQHITDKQIYSLYSCLATLHYETKKYSKSLEYAKKMLESSDSLMLRGCYLHLFRAYNQLGMEIEAKTYRELYMRYHSDISLRLKTKELAKIPYQVRAKQLQVENLQRKRVQWKLTMWIVVIVVMGILIYLFVHKRHKGIEATLYDTLYNNKKERENEKRRYESELEKKEQDKRDLRNRKNWEIGRLNEYLSRGKRHIKNVEEELQKEKDRVKEKVDEIKQLKENSSIIMREKRALEKNLEASLKGQRELQMVSEMVEHNKRIEQHIMRYRLDAKVENIACLLIQLKHGNMCVEKPLPRKDILPMLTALLDEEYPGMRQRIDNLTNNTTKQTMCYLIALKLDDEEMMYRATNIKLETVRKYRKECRDLVANLTG